MAATDQLFAGAIPDIYDGFMVPLLFDFYALDLTQRLAQFEMRDVLEAAAGAGALTRPMARRLPAATRIVATDLNQAMLDLAARRLPADSRIGWQQADALALPFEDKAFDAVVCQFGVMFYPDKMRGYREARRVLRPGGHFLFNIWDKISENQFAHAVHNALGALFGADAPDFMARTPHGYHDAAKIQEELRAAGFSSVSVEAVEAVSRARSPLHAAIAFCQGTPMRSEIEARYP
jgi:ubiquinone/menaquinone biosynthesis C-methylase UbiE